MIRARPAWLDVPGAQCENGGSSPDEAVFSLTGVFPHRCGADDCGINAKRPILKCFGCWVGLAQDIQLLPMAVINLCPRIVFGRFDIVVVKFAMQEGCCLLVYAVQ